MRTRVATIAALVLAALALGACAPAARPSEPAQQTQIPQAQVEPTPAPPPAEESAPMANDLSGTSWNLSALDGAAPAASDRPATLEFDSAGGLAGSTGCNRYFGGVTVTGGTLAVGQMGSTKMACPEPLMDQELAFLAILGHATSYIIADDTLTITADDGRTLAFTRA